MMTEPVTILVYILGAAGVLGSSWAVFQASKNKTDIASLHASNDELRATVAYERGEREREKHDCKIEIATMTSKIEVLQGDVVRGLVTAFSVALKEALQEVLGRSETTPPLPAPAPPTSIDVNIHTEKDPHGT